MKKNTAAIINIGYELTTGRTLNTHAQYLSEQLNLLGYHVKGIVTCADVKKDIVEALKFYADCDRLFVTGGLGPTVDDLTREAIAERYHLPLVQDADALVKLNAIFNKLNRDMPANNLKQASFPKGSERIINDKGTADAFYLEVDKKIIFVLPGPPREMKHIFEKIIPMLEKGRSPIITTLKLFGIGECHVDAAIGHLLINNDDITSGIYASAGEITVRFLQWTKNETTKTIIRQSVNNVQEIFGEYVFASEDINLSKALLNLLKTSGQTISFAESCTGGLLAKSITDLAGASSIINGSVVTYSNDVKKSLLNVSADALKTYGAVSETVCSEMLIGLDKLFNADLSIAVTGIAGPGGGSKEKPLGLVYIGISYRGKRYIHKCNFRGEREHIRTLTKQTAFFNAIKLLKTSLD